MTLKYLIRKEFLQIRRNPFLPKLVFIYPIFIMCVMPWAMNMKVNNIKVDMVDNDRSTFSRQLIQRIEASRYFIFNGQKPTYQHALDDIERNGADMVMVIPKGFGRNMSTGSPPTVLVAANAVNGTKGIIGTTYLSQIVISHVSPDLQALQRKISLLYLYNKHQDYKVFMIPSLMAILVMLLCGFLPALNIVGEKEQGTIEQMNVTPVSKWSFIFAKLIPYWFIALVVMTLCFILSWAVYGITSQGNLLLVYFIAMLLALIFSSIGLIVSNYSDTMQQAIFVMWFIVDSLLLLSGLFTPVRSMPEWTQVITTINPMHYFIDAVRTVFVRGGNFADIGFQISILALFATIMSIWAIHSYKKNS